MTHSTRAELIPARLFGGIEPAGIAIVAVSGGSDSLALLLLAHVWATEKNLTLHAVTVDHGLRPEAAAEAGFVGAVCEGLGIDHTTLGWDGLKPHSGLPDAARRARYTIMEEFAGAIGATTILTGHTLDDQAETVWMRSQRGEAGSGGRGLSGMARITLLPGGTQLVRPLLEVTRGQLRDYLATYPQSWVEDPTNRDPSYERVRVRRMLKHNPALRDRLAEFSKAAARLRAVKSRDTALLLQATTRMEAGPVFHLDMELAIGAPRSVLLHALQILIAIAGGGEYLVPPERLAALIDEGDGEDRRSVMRNTLGGAVIERVSGGLRFYRERRNLESVLLAPGESVLWDGRFEIVNNTSDTVHAGALTRLALKETESTLNRQLDVRPRAALLSSLMVGTAKGDIHFPFADTGDGVSGLELRLTARAIEYFCPETDFPLLEWLHGLDAARNAFLQPRS